MSASGMGGGGKSANFELNLVPFIDLLSTLICFLLITAVWSEMDAISTGVPPKVATETPPDPSQPPPPQEKKTVLTLSIGVDRTDISENEAMVSYPFVGGEPDLARMGQALTDLKKKYPGKRDIVLATDNSAKYKYLVQVMDLLKAQDFPDIGITLN